MIIIADSGSTKSDWICIDPENGLSIFNKQRTKGLNPSVISKKQAFGIINKNPVLNQNKHFVKHVFFYGDEPSSVSLDWLLLKKSSRRKFKNKFT